MKNWRIAVTIVFTLILLIGCGSTQKTVFDDVSGKMTISEVRAIKGDPDEEVNDFTDHVEKSWYEQQDVIADTYNNVELFGYKGKAVFNYYFNLDYTTAPYKEEDTELSTIDWSLESGKNFTEKEYQDISKKLTKKFGDPSVVGDRDEWYDESDNKYILWYEKLRCILAD